MAMKKVRYLIGAVGALPALGVIAPTATAAHAPAAAQKTSSKAVSLRSSGTAAPSTITPCDGVLKVTAKGNTQTLTFWSGYLNGTSACIGTVEGSWSTWPDSRGWLYRVRIYSGTGAHQHTPIYSKKTGGTVKNVNTVYGAQGVHKYYRYPVQVCTAWSTTFSIEGGQTEKSVTTPLCKTIDRRPK
jgi:hypothetical protein